MPSIPFFDTKECEWADMSIVFAGSPLIKVRGVKYKASKSKELLHAAGDMPISIQSGNREYEGEIKVLKGALDNMNTAAVAAGGDDALDVSFDIVLTYRAKGSRALQTDTLVNVEIKEFEKGWEQGAKMMEVTLPILFTQIVSAP